MVFAQQISYHLFEIKTEQVECQNSCNGAFLVALLAAETKLHGTSMVCLSSSCTITFLCTYFSSGNKIGHPGTCITICM